MRHRFAFFVRSAQPACYVHNLIAANETLDIEYRDDRASWDAFVTKINDALNPLDLEFSRMHDEINGVEVYAVVRPMSCYHLVL